MLVIMITPLPFELYSLFMQQLVLEVCVYALHDGTCTGSCLMQQIVPEVCMYAAHDGTCRASSAGVSQSGVVHQYNR